MFHCHNLVHEDNDMLQAFVTKAAGNRDLSVNDAFVRMRGTVDIMYSNFGYNNPLYGECNASLSSRWTPISNGFLKSKVWYMIGHVQLVSIKEQQLLDTFSSYNLKLDKGSCTRWSITSLSGCWHCQLGWLLLWYWSRCCCCCCWPPFCLFGQLMHPTADMHAWLGLVALLEGSLMLVHSCILCTSKHVA
jgi:hypothetical protein